MSIDWSQVILAEEKRKTELVSLRVQQKTEKQKRVSEILVTVDGFVFQGDEKSQGRLLRQADTMQEGSSTRWVLADNSIVPVTKEQLRLAAKLSLEEMNRIWLS